MKKLISCLLIALTLSTTAACGPRPVPVDGGAVTPSGWTDTARLVLTTLRWAVPAARAILAVTLPEPARTSQPPPPPVGP